MTCKALLATIRSTTNTNTKNYLRATFKHLQTQENKIRYSENFASQESPCRENKFAYVYWDRLYPNCALLLFRNESCQDIPIYIKKYIKKF